jgi:hypothetical protein
MQSTLDIQSGFLDMWRSTTAGRHPHRALELRLAETTISASQIEALELRLAETTISTSQIEAHLQAVSRKSQCP